MISFVYGIEMKKICIKYSVLDYGKESIFDCHEAQFSFRSPFRVFLSLGLGFEEEDALSDFGLVISSFTKNDDVQLGKVWYVDELNQEILKSKLDQIISEANKTTNPLLEASRHLEWEYS